MWMVAVGLSEAATTSPPLPVSVCRNSTHGLRMNGHWEITPEGASEEPLYAVGKEMDSSSYPTRSCPPAPCACQPSAAEKSVELLACGIVLVLLMLFTPIVRFGRATLSTSNIWVRATEQNQEPFMFVLTLQNWRIMIIRTGKRRRRLSSVQCQVLLLSLSSSCFWP